MKRAKKHRMFELKNEAVSKISYCPSARSQQKVLRNANFEGFEVRDSFAVYFSTDGRVG